MCNMSGQCAWPGLQLNYFLHFSSSHNRMGDQFSTYSVAQIRLLITDLVFLRFDMQYYFAWRKNISNREIVYGIVNNSFKQDTVLKLLLLNCIKYVIVEIARTLNSSETVIFKQQNLSRNTKLLTTIIQHETNELQ